MASQLKTDLEKRVQEKMKPRQKKPKKKEPFRGRWVLFSTIDGRWCAEGTSEIGGDRMPDEVVAKVEELKKKLGNPPDDLNWTYDLD